MREACHAVLEGGVLQLDVLGGPEFTFLRDSQQVVMELKAIGQLPPHAGLFTSDDTAIYTNIEPGVGFTAIKECKKQQTTYQKSSPTT
jgi:hypothetical protein